MKTKLNSSSGNNRIGASDAIIVTLQVEVSSHAAF